MAEEGEVGFDGAGVAGEVGGVVELGGIDEEGDGDDFVLLTGAGDEGGAGAGSAGTGPGGYTAKCRSGRF